MLGFDVVEEPGAEGEGELPAQRGDGIGRVAQQSKRPVPPTLIRGSKRHKTYRSSVVRVAYPWHPLHGQEVELRRRAVIGETEFVHIDVARPFSREIPAWMVDATACAAMQLGRPVVAVSALEALLALLRAAHAPAVTVHATPDRPQEEAPDEEVACRVVAADNVEFRRQSVSGVALGEPQRSRSGAGDASARRRRKTQPSERRSR